MLAAPAKQAWGLDAVVSHFFPTAVEQGPAVLCIKGLLFRLCRLLLGFCLGFPLLLESGQVLDDWGEIALFKFLDGALLYDYISHDEMCV